MTQIRDYEKDQLVAIFEKEKAKIGKIEQKAEAKFENQERADRAVDDKYHSCFG